MSWIPHPTHALLGLLPCPSRPGPGPGPRWLRSPKKDASVSKPNSESERKMGKRKPNRRCCLAKLKR